MDITNIFYQIEKYFVRCEYGNWHDAWNDPQGGSYAIGYSNNECGCEVDYYICGKCATLAIQEIIKEQEHR